MDIAILVYEGFTALDAVGPYEVLSRLPGARTRFVATTAGPVTTDTGVLTLVAGGLEEMPRPALVVVPGGPGEVAVRAGDAALDWLRSVHPTTEWTTSVCTGSLVLGAAGLLDGVRATSHWLALEQLGRLGAIPVRERVVIEEGRRIVTAAGVSAGIDMGLVLAARIAGELVAQGIQLGIEYDPQPPFDSGSPDRAPAEVVELLRARSRFLTARCDGLPRRRHPAALGLRAGRRGRLHQVAERRALPVVGDQLGEGPLQALPEPGQVLEQLPQVLVQLVHGGASRGRASSHDGPIHRIAAPSSHL